MNMPLIDRILDSITDCLSVDAAKRIVALRADAETQARADELADKANRGTLSDEERAEYDRLLGAFHFVTVIQARARKVVGYTS